jgi:lipopolysaccharide/colanic/teichoic acid biosynthesis glycosyltransferase
VPIESPGLRYRACKRALDVAVASAALLVLTPLLVAIALIIWVQDPRAPVLFRQRRTGKGGRTFQLFKFRTMVRDADAMKEELRALSAVAWPDFRLVDDPRVSPLGRFLRRSSLDELPQLINVLRGDMSLVGPRPTSFASDTYLTWQTGRLDYQPGLTGPWQVYGRSTLDFAERCRLEIAFFRRPSLLRELGLIVRTIGVVFGRTGVA